MIIYKIRINIGLIENLKICIKDPIKQYLAFNIRYSYIFDSIRS